MHEPSENTDYLPRTIWFSGRFEDDFKKNTFKSYTGYSDEAWNCKEIKIGYHRDPQKCLK